MIEILEQALRATWSTVGRGRPEPRRIHIAKLSQADYPAPDSALVILLFADREARPVAVAKVARVAEGDAPVEREIAALERIGSLLPEDLAGAVPRLLWRGGANGRAAFLCNALPGEIELHHTWGPSAARRSTPRMRAALDWGRRAAAATAAGTVSGAAWLGIGPSAALAALAGLGCDEARLRRLEPRLAAIWASAWPAALAHGDFFPGNILFDRARGIGVVDWMLSEARAPVFFDPLTYELSFGLHALQADPAGGWADRAAVHALPAFAAAREIASADGLDLGLAGQARLAVLLRGALRDGTGDGGRRRIGATWVRLLEVELDASV